MHADRSQQQFQGGGEMARRVREHDWSGSGLGAPDEWPVSLRTTIRVMLASRYAMFVWWGPDLVSVYNDGYVSMLGARHPDALGRPARQTWAEIWDVVGPRAEAVLSGGTATLDEDLLLVMERNGYPEETYFTFSYSPAYDDEGGVGGVFCACSEETQKVVGARQLALLARFAARAVKAGSVEDACAGVMAALGTNSLDFPFAALYLPDPAGGYRLAGTSGIAAGHAACPKRLDAAAWPVEEALAAGGLQVVEDLPQRFADLPHGGWDRPPCRGAVVPIAAQGEDAPAALLVVGLNPLRVVDAGYREFIGLVAGQVGSALATARAYDAERRRAAALAEIDRAKTAFFSNVSHEFRTPLTLLLGPLEDVMARGTADAQQARDLALAHRNALRLLKLVNALLDFSRLEAGRMRAAFRPVELATLTADLASSFRAACDKAGLALTVRAAPLPEPAYVDRDMWEKVVLNLLSNAFKYTFAGGIEVTVAAQDGQAVLSVADTGTGIPAADLPQLFDRFYRVEDAHGRSHEGTGIGLAVTRELVRLHGGRIAVESTLGKGTRLTVAVPFGTAHLPAEHVLHEPPQPAATVRSLAYVEEALHWLPDTPDTAAPAEAAAERPHVLLADDNADMREYLSALLAPRYDVVAVADGAAALAAARARRPELILSDVMMPRLDGFGLIAALRADPALRDVPVVLLSARAGEEAKVEGLQCGADDYLVKPFGARELLARISANLEMAGLRRRAAEALRESEARFRHLAEHAPVMVWETGPDGSCSYLSRSWYEFTGQCEEEGLGFGWLAAIHPDDRPAADRAFREANAATGPFRIEYRLRRADGSYRWAIDAAAPRFAADGRFLGYVGSVLDIHERKSAEERLRRSEAHLRAVYAQTGAGFAETDRTGRFIAVNDRYCEMVGRSRAELLTLHMQDITHPEDLVWNLPLFMRLVEGGDRFSAEKRYLRPDGEVVWVAISVAAVDIPGENRTQLAVAIDIGERKRAEAALAEREERLRLLNADLERRVEETAAQLVQMQKMESIGRLTGGVAHDFNNLLMAILTSLEVVRLRLPDDDARLAMLVDNATQAAQRGAALTQRMLAFARKQELKPESVAIPELMYGMTDLLARSLGAQIAIETRFAPDLPLALVDANQLEMAVLNLAVNARDAMPDGGTLSISADAKRIGSGEALPPGTYVRLRVADTGAGMDRATLERAMEPFFTTKGTGKGTGLGLSMVHGLAAQSGGRFVLHSTPAQGTTAEILLPVAPEESVPAAPDGRADTVGPAPACALRVLVVDDDALVLASMTTVLEELGHASVGAASGAEALDLLHGGAAIDVVVTDQMMPGMTGSQLAAAIRERWPQLPVVVATGFAELPIGAEHGFAHRLRKPFGPADLVRAVQTAARQLAG